MLSGHGWTYAIGEWHTHIPLRTILLLGLLVSLKSGMLLLLLPILLGKCRI